MRRSFVVKAYRLSIKLVSCASKCKTQMSSGQNLVSCFNDLSLVGCRYSNVALKAVHSRLKAASATSNSLSVQPVQSQIIGPLTSRLLFSQQGIKKNKYSSYAQQRSRDVPIRLSDFRKQPQEEQGFLGRLENEDEPDSKAGSEKTGDSTSFNTPKQKYAYQQRQNRKHGIKTSVNQKTGTFVSKRHCNIDPQVLYERAMASASGSLSRRPHSRRELRDKLLLKEHDADAVEKVLDWLQEVELQSDADYAEVFVRSKWRQNKWAPSRLRRELQRKGIGHEDTEAALHLIFGSDTRRVTMTESWETSEDSFDGPDQQLLDAVRRKLSCMTSCSKETRKRRLIGWLQRRGHGWDVVSVVLKDVGLMSS